MFGPESKFVFLNYLLYIYLFFYINKTHFKKLNNKTLDLGSSEMFSSLTSHFL